MGRPYGHARYRLVVPLLGAHMSTAESVDADTFHGLARIVASKTEMVKYLISAIEQLDQNGFKRMERNKRVGQDPVEIPYEFANVADTFHSDTLSPDLMRELASVASAHGVRCQVLFLNPFCYQAKVRGMLLDAEIAGQQGGSELAQYNRMVLDWSDRWNHAQADLTQQVSILEEPRLVKGVLARTYSGLRKWATAVAPLTDGEVNRAWPETPEDLLQYLTLVTKQLSNSRKLSALGLEFRFTSDLLNMPFVVIGDYAYNGTMPPRSSAADRPWCLYRDDTGRTNDDMYEALRESFKQAWDHSAPLALIAETVESYKANREGEAAVMIAYSDANMQAAAQVRLEVEISSNERVESLLFPMDDKAGVHTGDVVAGLLKRASAGIALLLDDEQLEITTDDGSRQVSRTRQNVIHELGLMHAKYGYDRVLILEQASGAELDIPSNLDGLSRKSVEVNENGKLDENDLRAAVTSFLSQLN